MNKLEKDLKTRIKKTYRCEKKLNTLKNNKLIHYMRT